MTKPIGYYTGHPLGQGGILEELEQQWGSQFEKLTDNERMWLLAQLARQHWFNLGDSVDIRDGVITASVRLQEELDTSRMFGMMDALIDQLKNKW